MSLTGQRCFPHNTISHGGRSVEKAVIEKTAIEKASIEKTALEKAAGRRIGHCNGAASQRFSDGDDGHANGTGG